MGSLFSIRSPWGFSTTILKKLIGPTRAGSGRSRSCFSNHRRNREKRSGWRRPATDNSDRFQGGCDVFYFIPYAEVLAELNPSSLLLGEESAPGGRGRTSSLFHGKGRKAAQTELSIRRRPQRRNLSAGGGGHDFAHILRDTFRGFAKSDRARGAGAFRLLDADGMKCRASVRKWKHYTDSHRGFYRER